eukprot:9935498-Karenia_brevis.AAC.1
MQETLESSQPVEQAGFRSGFNCDDHLLTMVLLIEKLNEFQLPLWACTVDFKKAFDTVDHGPMWKALLAQGVPKPYVELLSVLYSNQVGHVVGRST